LEFINKLQPVTYHLNNAKIDAFNGIERTAENNYPEKNAINEITFSGFIAQDVETAANDVNYDFSGVVAPDNPRQHYKLRYAEFVVPLVKSVQELSAENNALKLEVEALKTQNEKMTELESRLERLESRLIN